ncbi:hypothetical protein A6P39_041380 [Streptomyces sp. FXJ1.172]|uniref:hypothetical protein n=1 Tax=Streptomyces sp. FXJ1.172 TaxID=710705 RepID=UPI0007CFDDE4|nr:hypothetical protein [Streptomyces sp. FXJ1.172]WEO99964.1 hypothetical protein A6P39_041380 [Streptomyces sp. FXJ1.172]
MKALVIDCTLEQSPEPPSTGALTSVDAKPCYEHDVQVTSVRAAALDMGLDDLEGRLRRGLAHTTGRTVVGNLFGVARALAVLPSQASR